MHLSLPMLPAEPSLLIKLQQSITTASKSSATPAPCTTLYDCRVPAMESVHFAQCGISKGIGHLDLCVASGNNKICANFLEVRRDISVGFSELLIKTKFPKILPFLKGLKINDPVNFSPSSLTGRSLTFYPISGSNILANTASRIVFRVKHIYLYSSQTSMQTSTTFA